MADSVFVDNDVILKTCCYDAVEELVACVSGASRTVNCLGVTKFVLASVIRRKTSIVDKDRAADRLSRFLTIVGQAEPTSEELELAAQFEGAAQSVELELDVGESQLLAMLIRRSGQLLLTGDKRAIRAIEHVVRALSYSDKVARRVACLEQIVMSLVARHGAETFHVRICREANIDAAMAICFSCTSGGYDRDSVTQGLGSYIKHLRETAPSVLVESDDLSAVIPQEDGKRRL